MGHCQVLPPLCSFQVETAVVGSQQGLPCWPIGVVTAEQELVVNGFTASRHSIQIMRTISENWEKNIQLLIQICYCVKPDLREWPKLRFLDFNDLPWHWSESLAKIRSDFVGEQSQIRVMPISAHWKHKNSIHIDFISLNGGATTFFPWVYIICSSHHCPL